MVTAANYPVALVSNGQNTRITARTSTTRQSTNMKGDHRTKPRALLLFLPTDEQDIPDESVDRLDSVP